LTIDLRHINVQKPQSHAEEFPGFLTWKSHWRMACWTQKFGLREPPACSQQKGYPSKVSKEDPLDAQARQGEKRILKKFIQGEEG